MHSVLSRANNLSPINPSEPYHSFRLVISGTRALISATSALSSLASSTAKRRLSLSLPIETSSLMSEIGRFEPRGRPSSS